MPKGGTWLNQMLLQGPFLCLCIKEEEFLYEMRRADVRSPSDWVSDGSDATTHFVSQHGESATFVCIDVDTKKPKIESHMLLVHEAVHVWRHRADALGLSRSDEEVEAYAIQHIATRLVMAFEDRMGRKKFAPRRRKK